LEEALVVERSARAACTQVGFSGWIGKNCCSGFEDVFAELDWPTGAQKRFEIFQLIINHAADANARVWDHGGQFSCAVLLDD
jgi:hypothetical protein